MAAKSLDVFKCKTLEQENAHKGLFKYCKCCILRLIPMGRKHFYGHAEKFVKQYLLTCFKKVQNRCLWCNERLMT